MRKWNYPKPTLEELIKARRQFFNGQVFARYIKNKYGIATSDGLLFYNVHRYGDGKISVEEVYKQILKNLEEAKEFERWLNQYREEQERKNEHRLS